jgi:hypothetical protein
MPHGLYGLAIDRVRLPLYFSKGNTLQARLPFQDTQRIRGLDAGNLPRITGENNSGSLIFGEVQQALHLPARNHARFIDDQYPAAQPPLWFLTLQQSRDGHCISETDLFQFVHCTSGGSYGKNLASGVSQAAVDFTERGSLARTGSPSNVYREIARIKHCLDSVPLFGTEMFRNLKVAALPEAVVAIHSAINDHDHVTLAIEARVCRNFIPSGYERSSRTLKGEGALEVAEFNVAASVTKSLG